MARITCIALVLACIVACVFTTPLTQNSYVIEPAVRSSHGHHSAPVHTANVNHIASHDSTNNQGIDEDEDDDEDNENDDDDSSDDHNGDESDDSDDNEDAKDMSVASHKLSASVRASRCKRHCAYDRYGKWRCRKSCFPKWAWGRRR